MELHICKYVDSEGQYTENQPYYEPDRVIDDFQSIVWCERFNEPGDFVLTLNATPELLQYFQNNEVLIARPDTGTVMIPEKIEATTSTRNGNQLKITGFSAENLLNMRLVMQGSTFSGKAEQAIEHYAKNNILADKYYSDPGSGNVSRFIPFFHYEVPEYREINFPETVSVSAKLEKLGDTISTICKLCGFGYRVRFDISTRKMFLSVYRGLDRSTLQSKNNPVIFSSEFYNISGTYFTLNRETYFNYLYNDDGSCISKNADMAGVKRRETVADQLDNDVELYREKIDVEVELNPNGQFKYRQDYNLGDIVEVRNAIGVEGTAVVTEIVETEDAQGYRLVPTLSQWRG